jgi:hypothetical protein
MSNNLEKEQIFGNENLLGLIKEPFAFNHITGIMIFMIPSSFGRNTFFRAKIEFTNGSTSGTQTIDKENMDDCYLAMRAFIQQLSDRDKDEK